MEFKVKVVDANVEEKSRVAGRGNELLKEHEDQYKDSSGDGIERIDFSNKQNSSEDKAEDNSSEPEGKDR